MSPLDADGRCGIDDSEMVRSLRAWLVRSDRLEKADLIFVLAGHRSRKVFGARLFRDGFAPTVLMSTGDPPFIARVLESQAAASVPLETSVWSHVHRVGLLPSPAGGGHFFARLDEAGWQVDPIRAGTLGTLSEMKALADWLRRHPSVKSLLIVSIGIHLRRVWLCCQALLPNDREVRLIATTTDTGSTMGREQEAEHLSRGLILLEGAKVLLYRLILIGLGWNNRQMARSGSDHSHPT